MKNMKSLMLVGLLIGQGLVASDESIFTTAGKNMVARQSLANIVGSAYISLKEANSNGCVSALVPTAVGLGLIKVYKDSIDENGKIKKFDKNYVKEAVGETGEAVAWTATGIGMCTATAMIFGADSELAFVGCTTLYGAFLLSAAMENKFK